MIHLRVDEGFAFDFLSILEVKLNKNRTINNIDNYNRCILDLSENIGENLLKTILNSDEYLQLLNLNFKTYEAVELAKSDSVSASYVDRCNYDRYLSKVALMKKFFNNKEISEVKIGYEIYEKSKDK